MGAASAPSAGGNAGLPTACAPAKPPVICDPVHNIGCLVPFSFCDIDPMQSVPAGRCVFPFTSTPPVGMCLYAVSAISKVPLWPLAKELWPYIVALTVCLFLITYIPGIVVWIPNLVMGASR